VREVRALAETVEAWRPEIEAFLQRPSTAALRSIQTTPCVSENQAIAALNFEKPFPRRARPV
jgi:hypothetical protein